MADPRGGQSLHSVRVEQCLAEYSVRESQLPWSTCPSLKLIASNQEEWQDQLFEHPKGSPRHMHSLPENGMLES